jgi:hypothetical protein
MNTNTHRPHRTFETIEVKDARDLGKAMSHLSQIVSPQRLGDPFVEQIAHEVSFALVVDGQMTPKVPMGSFVVFGHGLDDRVVITTMTKEDVKLQLGDVVGGTTMSLHLDGAIVDAVKPAPKPTQEHGHAWYIIEKNDHNSRLTKAMPIPGIGVVLSHFVHTGFGAEGIENLILVPHAQIHETIGPDNQSRWEVANKKNRIGVEFEPGSIVRDNGDVQANPAYDPFADGLREAASVVAAYLDSTGWRPRSADPAPVIVVGDDEEEKVDANDVVASKVCADITEKLMARITACREKTFNDSTSPVGA